VEKLDKPIIGAKLDSRRDKNPKDCKQAAEAWAKKQ
jgi:hypothetical protein